MSVLSIKPRRGLQRDDGPVGHSRSDAGSYHERLAAHRSHWRAIVLSLVVLALVVLLVCVLLALATPRVG